MGPDDHSDPYGGDQGHDGPVEDGPDPRRSAGAFAPEGAEHDHDDRNEFYPPIHSQKQVYGEERANEDDSCVCDEEPHGPGDQSVSAFGQVGIWPSC
jgi:hypothetical protein